MASSLPVNQGIVTQNSYGISGSTPLVNITSPTNYLLIQNSGTSDIYVSFSGNNAGIGQGFLLKSGASIEFANFIPLGLLYAYSVSGSCLVLTA